MTSGPGSRIDPGPDANYLLLMLVVHRQRLIARSAAQAADWSFQSLYSAVQVHMTEQAAAYAGAAYIGDPFEPAVNVTVTAAVGELPRQMRRRYPGTALMRSRSAWVACLVRVKACGLK